jgi:hypothetical protein
MRYLILVLMLLGCNCAPATDLGDAYAETQPIRELRISNNVSPELQQCMLAARDYWAEKDERLWIPAWLNVDPANSNVREQHPVNYDEGSQGECNWGEPDNPIISLWPRTLDPITLCRHELGHALAGSHHHREVGLMQPRLPRSRRVTATEGDVERVLSGRLR